MNILKFCNSEDRRNYANKPFNLDGRTFATDSNIIISVPRQGQWSGCELDMIDGVHRLMSDHARQVFQPYSYVAANQIGKLCQACNGIGRLHVDECNECDGSGCLSFSSDYNNYEVTCESCGGDGDNRFPSFDGNMLCDGCNGLGVKYPDVDIFGCTFKLKYISLISKLKNLEISVIPDQCIMFFKAEKEISGVVMGLRKDWSMEVTK